MSAAVGAVSTTKDVPFKAHVDEEVEIKGTKNVGGEPDQLPHSDGANYNDDAEETDPDEEEEDTKLESDKEVDLGPQFSLKEHIEKDKVRFPNVSSLLGSDFPTVL